jgi:membrane protease subunit HflC
MLKRILIAATLLVLLLWGLSCVFVVDRPEFVYVTQFGRPIETFDGTTDSGLHWKLPWPIQSVQRVDHRLQVFDLPETELPTLDRSGKTIDKMLTVSAYVCWQVADKQGVDQFIRSVGTPDRARTILGQRISSRLGAEIGNMPLEDLISVAPSAVVEQRMDGLRQRLLGSSADSKENLKDLARRDYGVEIVDIRLRRFNHPAGVRSAIFERIISERNKKVADYQSQGLKLAEDIKSAADREARDILTEARSREERLKREADVKADDIRNQAHARDREFYTFLQKLEAYQRMLGESKDVLLLSSKNEVFDMLLKPPQSKGPSPNGPAVQTVPQKGNGTSVPKGPVKEGGQ